MLQAGTAGSLCLGASMVASHVVVRPHFSQADEGTGSTGSPATPGRSRKRTSAAVLEVCRSGCGNHESITRCGQLVSVRLLELLCLVSGDGDVDLRAEVLEVALSPIIA
jgi:hypothetical protein